MEDFYKERYESMYKDFLKEQREARFYRNLVWFICGITNALTLIIFWFAVAASVIYIGKNWDYLSVSDKVSLFIASLTILGVVIKYGGKLMNWPEELYLYTLRKEKKVEDLTK